MRDFYVSYHVSDEDYAKWLAGQLEAAGYSAHLAAWDFRAGSNLIVEVQAALTGKAQRVIALLSPDYLLGELSQAELAAAFGQDPAGQRGRLLPVMIRPCTPTGLLAQLRAVHLENLDEASARQRLLESLDPDGPIRRAPFPAPRTRGEHVAFPRDPQWRLQRLPLPLAQLFQRTLNSKSAADRHANAYYLAEATLKLAAALRIGLWLERALIPGGELAQRLEMLMLPEPAHWLALLCEVDEVLGRRQDSALLPIGTHLGQLGAPQCGWVGVAALAEAARVEGVAEDESWDGTPPTTLRTFFELVLAYRSRILYAAPRGADFCTRMAELWLAALAEVLEAPALFGDLRLAHAQVRSEGAGFAWAWQDLTGPVNLPLVGLALPARDDVQPGALYFTGPGTLVPLGPLIAYCEDDLGRGAVGFLHPSRRRVRSTPAAGGEAVEVVRADYLDYATGQNLRGMDASEALTGLLRRLRGRPATTQDLEQVQQRSAAASSALPVDTISADAALGDFELLGELGRGGMAIVYKARQRSLRRMVALKVLPPSLAADATLAQRFRREVAALGRCAHPHVVGILGSGVDHDRAYYAMELIDGADLGKVGKTLAAWQKTGGPLYAHHVAAAVAQNINDSSGNGSVGTAEPPPGQGGDEPHLLPLRLAELFADAALGLAYLHQQSIIHRDIKPGNLMLTRDGQRIVLADLGLARLLDASQALSQSQMPQVGTLRYMAPELLAGQPADGRSDVYALGASLYELLAGHPMHDGQTETHLRQQILSEQPLSLRRLGRTFPKDLASVIEIAVARDPSHRYPTAQALAADLRAVAEHRPIAARPPGLLHRLQLSIHRRPEVAALTGLLILLPLLFTFSYWQWARESAAYFTTYVERNGVWEGIGRVYLWKQRHLNTTFRFIRQKGRLIRVESVNGLGFLRDDSEEEASWQFIYDADSDRVLKIVSRDQRGIVQRWRVYNDDLTRLEYKDRQGRPKPKQGTDISLDLRELDERGFIKREHFATLHEAPRINDEGAHGYELTKDERGLTRRRLVLREDGSRGITKRGISSTAYEYDLDGHQLNGAYFGVDDKPTLDERGVARWQSRYDERGNQIETAFFGVDGKPTLLKDGYAVWQSRYDEHGNQIERAFFGVDGKPILHMDGNARWRSRYDERGNQIETAFFGVDGKPILLKDGYAAWQSRYDERGNQIETAFFGVDGKPILHKDGLALWRSRYDERGNRIETAHFGVDGKPILHKDGLALGRSRYDDRGNEIERAYFGVDGKPTLLKDGYAVWRSRYDERGNEIEAAYFGVDGTPILHKDGSALWRSRYDDRGNEIERAYFGVDGQPILLKDGYAVWRRRYDERGNQTETAFFGGDGKPILQKDGYVLGRSHYDERGNEIERAYFGVDGQPILLKDGYAVWRRRYDERSNEIEIAYFGVDGAPILLKNGYSLRRSRYDERSNQIERAYFGVDGKPILHKDGYALGRSRYDERGNQIERAYFGVEGQPILHKDGHALWRSRYDERGNLIETAYFGVDGKPILLKYGFALWRSRYDERNNEIERAYFGVDGKSILHRDGPSLWRSRYDESGNRIERAYFGVDGQPILHKNRHSLWRSRYDEHGNQIERAYFGVDGKPILHRDGHALWRSRYDEHGNQIEQAYFGVDGQPILHSDGHALWRSRYDEHGNQIEQAYFGVDGKPILLKDGYAVRRSRFDERSNQVEEAYFGVDGKPTLHKDGYALWRTRFDDHGNQQERTYLGLDGKPTLPRKQTVSGP